MLSLVPTMPVKFALRKVVARKNLERANAGLPPLTQIEIAEGSRVSQSVISNLLANKSERIDLKTVNGLCNFFNIPPGELFDYAPDPAE